MAYLLITSGPSAGTSFDLKKCPLSIGREVTQDIQLLDPLVSRKHLTVQCTGGVAGRGGTYTITAQPNAKNGMLLNDKQVPEATLCDGDRVVIGETELTFIATDEPGKLDAIKRTRVWSKQSVAQTVKRPLNDA